MTIGFVVSFFDFRNDVRRVLAILSKEHNVIVYGNEAQKEVIMRHLPDNIVFRPILEEKSTFKNKILNYAFMMIKKIPNSKRNYYLMEWFKTSNIKDPQLREKGYQAIKQQQSLPKVMSFDFLLKNLDYSGKTDVSGIDKFIFFSEIANSYFLARLIKEQKPVELYVYSWDHAFKHTRFSTYPLYLCWSAGIREDLKQMQGIPENKIKIIGASQFGYISEFWQKLKEEKLNRTFPFEYIYFGCAIGIDDLVEQELAVIKQLAKVTAELRPELKFVVRPYPVLSKWELYEELKQIPNVILDDGFRNKDLSIKDEFIFEKFEKIHHATAFLHLGTTMGLEACYTDTPSFIVDFGYKNKDIFSLYSFIHQSQNEKYLIDTPETNALKNIEAYAAFLTSADPEKYIVPNQKVREVFPVISFEEFSKALVTSK